MIPSYKRIVKTVLTTLETFTTVKAPAAEYLKALKEARSEIDDWFEINIDAAKYDVKREEDNK